MIISLRESWIAPVSIGILLPFTSRPVKTTAAFLRLRPVSRRLHETLELSYRHRVFTDSEDSNLYVMLAFIILPFQFTSGDPIKKRPAGPTTISVP